MAKRKTPARPPAPVPAPPADASIPGEVEDGAPAGNGQPAQRPTSERTFLPFNIVAIGASAGGLQACSELLAVLPADFNMAVVVIQHLAPQQESLLPELLNGSTELSVVAAQNDMPLQPGRVYVIPPNVIMSIEDGKLLLGPRPQDHNAFMPIDFFFRSLADQAESRAVAIVLSGTASDGSLGVRDVKGRGGIVMVQDPQSAKFDGMPRAAIASGTADVILPPAQLAQELQRIASHPFVRPAPRLRAAENFDLHEDHLKAIFVSLRKATGVDFSHYKQPTIRRRLQRRMVLHKINSVGQYVRFLQVNPAEVSALYHDILINVTRFFREPESFIALADKVYPALAARAAHDAPIRIWVPGCSTGEEPYSIAMSLLEFLGGNAHACPMLIFATDVSETAIDHARQGTYTQAIAGDVSAERLRRFFTKVDGSYRIAKVVRDACVFARQDLTRDPPFSRLDLIVCRNVLIYLGAPLQKRLMNVFHYALKPTGHLLLGSSETIGASADLFAPEDKRQKLYTKRLATTPRHDVNFAAIAHDRSGKARPAAGPAPEARPGTLQSETNRYLLSRYAPPGVVVDQELRIVQILGQTGPYLEPAPGEASFNLLKMARDGLLFTLRAAMLDVKKKLAPVHRKNLTVRYHRQVKTFDLDVVPLPGDPPHYMVLFKEHPPQKAPAGAVKVSNKKPAAVKRHEQRLKRLEEELSASRDYLQSIIQDLEATNEELQSANEEVLSANEELQSTNEELDTAKEELQSTNEELNTVNEELQGRNAELSGTNSDLVNLLASVQIAIVIVSADLRIRRFTPMAERVLNLIPTDVGRPISDIKPNINCPELETMIAAAVDTVSVHEREVTDGAGVKYLLRVRPYKNVDSRIDGAVLALFDVDSERGRQEALADAAETNRRLREFSEVIVQTIREPLLVLSRSLTVVSANRAFVHFFDVPLDQIRNRKIYELGDGQWNIPRLRSLLEDVLPNNRIFEDFRVDHNFPGLGQRSLLLNARMIEALPHQDPLILLAFEDITHKKISAAGREPDGQGR